MKESLLTKIFVMFSKKEFLSKNFYLLSLKSRPDELVNGVSRNHFLQLKHVLGIQHVALQTPKIRSKELLLNSTEMQRVPDTENTDQKEEVRCQNRTKEKSSQNVSVNFNTDTVELNKVVYRFRIIFTCLLISVE